MNEYYTRSPIHTMNELLEVQASISKLNIEELTSISFNEAKGTLTLGLKSFDHLEAVKFEVKKVNIYGIQVDYEIAKYYERYGTSLTFPEISS